MSESLHPKAGARFLLVLADTSASGARYDAAVFTPEARFGYAVTLRFDGSSAVAPVDDPAPDALERKLGTMVRVIARDAASKRDDGFEPWPRRVLRWRGPT